jgi:hypothetical protein
LSGDRDLLRDRERLRDVDLLLDVDRLRDVERERLRVELFAEELKFLRLERPLFGELRFEWWSLIELEVLVDDVDEAEDEYERRERFFDFDFSFERLLREEGRRVDFFDFFSFLFFSFLSSFFSFFLRRSRSFSSFSTSLAISSSKYTIMSQHLDT